MAPPGRLVRLVRRVKPAPRARLDRLGLMVPRALLDPLVPRVTLVPPGLPEPPEPPERRESTVVVAHWA